MTISHLGTKDCVTGSCHLVQTRRALADLLRNVYLNFMEQQVIEF